MIVAADIDLMVTARTGILCYHGLLALIWPYSRAAAALPAATRSAAGTADGPGRPGGGQR